MRKLRGVSPVIGVAGVVLIAAVPARAGVDPHLGLLFASVVDEAAQRLDSPPCALVLLDFIDTQSGRPLADTLAASGLSASEHVRALRFMRSPRPPRVGALRLYAFTHPRDTEVFINWYDFSRLLTERRLAVAVVIHEVLHTLGLGNDLPAP